MHIQKLIEQFGYTPNEAKVYLAALNLGEATVSEISEKVKMPRTSVQIIANSLHKEGLMNFYVKRRYKYWIAESPEKFLTRLREQEAALRAVLPELQAIRRNKGDSKPTVKVFIGEEEIKLILDDIIATKHHFLVAKRPDAIIMKEKDEKELRETRFLPEDARINNMNFIYANKVALISLDKRRPTGVLIEDKDITNTMTVFLISLSSIKTDRKSTR